LSEPAPPSVGGRAALLELLGQRLLAAEELSAEMREGLHRGDAPMIDSATARLRTLVEEYRILAQELGRTPRTAAPDGEIGRALDDLERIATRLARHNAVNGGLLDGLVGMSRRLLETLSEPEAEAYSNDGRTRLAPLRGVKLREVV
jgi:hypothetical protein